MKIAFVIHRYGIETVGGSEFLCRQIAERLAKSGCDCTVYTSAAINYVTWKNEYSLAEENINGVRVKRFRVEKERDIRDFNEYSDWIFSQKHTHEDEIEWMDRQGPYCPELIKALEKEEKDFDIFIFFTYLYYSTYWGLRRIKGKKILVPCVHDEPALYLEIMKEVFSLPEAFIFNTESEKEMISRLFSFENKYQDVAGIGIEIPANLKRLNFRQRYAVSSPYILYAGRIERGKGCQELIDYFLRYNRKNLNLNLVFIGKLLMDLPLHPKIKYLGFLPAKDKDVAMFSAVVTVHPSRLESLGLAALESMAAQTPILVQAGAEPLKRHCLNGRNGLFYSNYEKFEEALNLFINNPGARRVMSINGLKYVQENYAWFKIMEKYNALFEHMLSLKLVS